MEQTSSDSQEQAQAPAIAAHVKEALAAYHAGAIVLAAAANIGSRAQTVRGAARALLSVRPTGLQALRQARDQLAPALPQWPRPDLSTAERRRRELAARIVRAGGSWEQLEEICTLCTSREAAWAVRMRGLSVGSVCRSGFRPADEYTRSRAARSYRPGYAAAVVHHEHQKKWTTKGPRTVEPAHIAVTYRSIAVIDPAGKRAVYHCEGMGLPARIVAPAGTVIEWRKRHLVAVRRTRSGAVTDVLPLELDWVIGGMHARRGMVHPMPPELRGEFGCWEYGNRSAAAVEIERKRRIVRERRAQQRRSRRDARAVRLLSRISSAPVSWADARAAGLCAPGIEAWAHARGIVARPGASVPCYVLGRDSDLRARRLAEATASGIWSRKGQALCA